MPVFVDGRIVAFVCNIAHHADMGGMAPGSMAGGMSEIYQEGLRVPVVRLFSAGELQSDILDIMLLNARLPEERRGDYFAQIASCRLGERRMAELGRVQGAERLEATFEEIIRRTEMRLRRALEAIPDGTYRFTDVMDDDGLGHLDIPISVAVTVQRGRLQIDFAGTSPQVRGNINCTMSATRAAACYTLKALLDPEIPNNHGVIDVIEIRAEKGSLVDAVFPAAVASRAHTCQRVIDAILGALAPALPERVVAAANGANTTAVFSGRDPRTGRDYVYLETLGGGFGGRPNKDGRDGVQVHITNTSNLPVEAIESEYPLFVESYGFVPDTGGAGRHRGGLALRRVIRPLGHEAVFSGTGERFRNPPWGLFGGENGACGRFVRIEADGAETVLPGKAADVHFGPDQCIAIETPGAGGHGPPAERPAAAVEDDVASGKFSPAFAARHYDRTEGGGSR
jgi:N-methylhydantoinase B